MEKVKLILFIIALIFQTGSAQEDTTKRSWDVIVGGGYDIAVYDENSIFLVGTDKWGIYKWSPSKNNWDRLPGGAKRVSVGSDVKPWIVGTDNGIYSWEPDINNWTKRPGGAIDIGVGEDGSVFIVGTDQSVYKWQGNNWEKLTDPPYKAKRIAVGSEGTPWITSPNGIIYFLVGSDWTIYTTEKANDITVYDDYIPWITGDPNKTGGRPIYEGSSGSWIHWPGEAHYIDVGKDGTPWIIGTDFKIYHGKSNQ